MTSSFPRPLALAIAALSCACSSSSFDVSPGATADATADASDGGEVDAAAESSVDAGDASDAAGDSAPGPDAPDAPAINCTDPATFPRFEKACTNAESCAFGLHQLDCCGSRIAIGFNHAFKAQFDAAETAWESTCPACGCASKPTVAEDGKTGDAFGVECRSGKCVTFVK